MNLTYDSIRSNPIRTKSPSSIFETELRENWFKNGESETRKRPNIYEVTIGDSVKLQHNWEFCCSELVNQKLVSLEGFQEREIREADSKIDGKNA
jgi:hypothetical protein